MNLSQQNVRKLILRARAYDSKEHVSDYTPDSDAPGNPDVEVFLASDNDPVRNEIEDWLSALDEEAQAELVALYWIGRGDYDGKDFPKAVHDARTRHTGPTADYLLGAPLIGDYLEIGLDEVIAAEVMDGV